MHIICFICSGFKSSVRLLVPAPTQWRSTEHVWWSKVRNVVHVVRERRGNVDS